MKVFVIAGEASGDKLGGAALAGLRSLVPDLEIHGVGGPLMQAEGLESLFPMDELSVMGLAEVLPKYRHLKRRIAQTAKAVLELKPDILLTIDSPDFCLRVARLVKAESPIRTVHYVAPTVWAWRPGRAQKMVGVVDQVLALFPFEPPYLETVGIRCDFVGHPVVAEPVASDAEVTAFRTAHDLGDAPILLALPGSRRGEINRLAGRFGAALGQVLPGYPEMRVVVPAAPGKTKLVRSHVSTWPGAPLVIESIEEKRAAFKAATVALAASGTVSLELAASATPMVIAYDMNWLSRQIIKRMLRVDTVTLVNLVSETRVVPEFLGADCQPDAIAKGLSEVIAEPNAQQAAMALTMERLGQGDEAPGLRAARAILEGQNSS
ncbi:MAG: lipid-A-disaccharide synthase [Pseudomonadota bacterium]